MRERVIRLTTGAVLFWDARHVVLIRRGRPPFEGHFALPGGFVEYGERVEAAILREVREETGLEAQIVDLLGVYSDPRRDPRGHTVTIVFVLRRLGGTLRAGDDAREAVRVPFPVDEALPLAFDHREILRDAVRWWSAHRPQLGGPAAE